MSSIRRALVIHPYGIGDLLFLTPVLRALRLVPTIEKVDLLVGSRTEAMIRPNPHLDEIITVNRDEMRALSRLDSLKAIWNLGKRLKRNRYDLLIDYSLRREYAAAAKFLFGVPRRAGFDYKNRGCYLNFKYPIPEGFSDRHAVHYFADAAEVAGFPVDHRVMEFYLSEESKAAATRTLEELGIGKEEPFVVVSPGGGESWGEHAHLKRWPVENFESLLRRLKGKTGITKFLVVGSPQEEAITEELSQAVEGAFSLAGKVDLTTVAGLIERAWMFVGNDGGLVHIAHALRKPLLAIYGPVDPRVYGPFPESDRAVTVFKGPVDYKKFRYNPLGKHIQEISPEMVWEALEHSPLLEQLAIA